MKSIKSKVIIVLILALFLFFFSNDFGLVDIDKTAIIVALAIDKGKEKNYEVTAEIAVPEATDQNTETKNAQVTGKGNTVGEALKEVSDLTGWYPQLNFCNLIVISDNLKEENMIKILNFFAITFKVQDSCLIAMSEGNAKDVLKDSSPLDDISSFAIQKILLKQPGFDKNVLENNVKDFCVSYYNPASSSYMPLITKQKAENTDLESSSGQNSQNNSQTSNSQESGKTFFSARKTALFKNGIMVGVLDKEQTLTYKMLKTSVKSTVYPVEKTLVGTENDQSYLLKIVRNSYKIKLKPSDYKLLLDISIDIFCNLNDVNSPYSHTSLSKNTPLPQEAKEAFTDKLKNDILLLVNISKTTGCDFFDIERKLYKYHYKNYFEFKDNFLEKIQPNVNVCVSGQK